ncbi:MAG: hypothetical protein KF681_16010 [Bdellovibrionaceae bacterium]|nr:hypothetical protein [Pseudobdellovibrionaceae bacterium]
MVRMKTNPMLDTEDGFVSLPLADVQAFGFDLISASFCFKPTSSQQRTHLENMSMTSAFNVFLQSTKRLRLQKKDGDEWFDLREHLPLKKLYGFRVTNCSNLKFFIKSNYNDAPYLHAEWSIPRYSEAIAGPALIDKSLARRIRQELRSTSKKSQTNLILKSMVRYLEETPTHLLNVGLTTSFDQLLGFTRAFLDSVPALASCEITIDIESVEAMLDLLMPKDVISQGAVQSIMQKSLHLVKDLSGFEISGIASNNAQEDRPLTTTFHDHLAFHRRSFKFKTYSKGNYGGTSHLRAEFKDKEKYRLGVCKSGLEAAAALKRSRSWKSISLVSESFSKRLEAKLQAEDVTPSIALIERVLREAGLSKPEITALLRGTSLEIKPEINLSLVRTCCDFKKRTSARLKPSLQNLVLGELAGRERFESSVKSPYKMPRILADKPHQFSKALCIARTRGIEQVTAQNVRSQNPPWVLGKSALSDFIKEFRRWWAHFSERSS